MWSHLRFLQLRKRIQRGQVHVHSAAHKAGVLGTPHTLQRKQKQKNPECSTIDPTLGGGRRGISCSRPGLLLSFSHDLCPSRNGWASAPCLRQPCCRGSCLDFQERQTLVKLHSLGSRTQGSALPGASPTDALESSLHVKLRVSPCTHPGGFAFSDCFQLLCVPSVSLFKELLQNLVNRLKN